MSGNWRKNSISRVDQISWLTESLDAYSPSMNENGDPSISSNSSLVAVFAAIQFCRDNHFLSVTGRGEVSMIKVALLVRNGTPKQIEDRIYDQKTRDLRSVDIIDAIKGINLILQQVLDTQPITLFGETFNAERRLEATNHIILGLVDAGCFIIKEETNPTDRSTLITDIMSGTVIESYDARVKKGKYMAYDILAHLRDRMVLIPGMKRLPLGHEKYIFDLVKAAYLLNDGFFGKSRISVKYTVWRTKHVKQQQPMQFVVMFDFMR